MTTMETTEQKGFAYGEHVVLRPVMVGDLPELAQLMAECPCDGLPTPWTHQRLKKTFENKDDPGLWGKFSRHFSVLRHEGNIVGYVHERVDQYHGIYTISFHVMDKLDDRKALACDLLRTYLTYKQTWHNASRINCTVIRAEQEKAACLESCGFSLEMTRERMVLHLGQPEALCIYAWMSEAHLEAPAWDVPEISTEDARK